MVALPQKKILKRPRRKKSKMSALPKSVVLTLKICAAASGFINGYAAFVPVSSRAFPGSSVALDWLVAPGKACGRLKVMSGLQSCQQTYWQLLENNWHRIKFYLLFFYLNGRGVFKICRYEIMLNWLPIIAQNIIRWTVINPCNESFYHHHVI